MLLSIKTGLERSHLIETLEQKIDELSKAKHKLENYNVELENIVKERTKELLKSNTDLESINRKLSGIINHCADGIVTVSKKGIISQINPVFKFLCGMTDFDILKNNFSDYFIDEINEPICSKFNPEKDILIRNYKILNKKTGKQIPVEISYAPITQENSAIEQYVCVIRNTTLQHEMDRLRDDFIATLTHDLRTPLLAAIQTLRFFLDGTLGQFDERQSKLLETMLNSNQDMLGLVNALLEVYKYESGQLVLFRDNFNLSELIHQCCSEIKSLIEKKLITLSINNQDNIEIYADKQELRRVLTNLLGNAFNYTPENGKISIIVESDKEFITVSVEDTGMGIPQEDIPKMFNRFSQGTSRKRSTGTGLGLYLSRQIIEAHGGKIWLESTVEKGSKFSFNIPINSEIINFTGFNNKSSNSC
jgi:PAS domain S-box-containing protein